MILVTRGNEGTPTKPEDPGALKVFSYKNGVLGDEVSIAPDGGKEFGPRHLDFHPTLPLVYVSIESQNKLFVYRRDPQTGLSKDPIFMKETLSDPNAPHRQGAGTIHVHPNGRFVYLTNRASTLVDFEGKKVFSGGENSVVAYAINQTTGEPTHIQSIDGHGTQLRTFALDPSARMLIAASIQPLPVRKGNSIETISAGFSVYKLGADGKLEFARKYDVDVGTKTQFWSGMVTLA